jgi:putative transposase
MENKAKRQEILKAVLHYFYMDNTRSGAHCRYNVKYHFVWIPKYRRKILYGLVAKKLKEILYEIAQEYSLKIIATEVMPDHVHLLVEVPPKYSPSYVIAIFKQTSSKLLRQEFPSYVKQYVWWKNTLWARGYYVATVADNATTGVVKEYINNQKLPEKMAPVSSCRQAALF